MLSGNDKRREEKSSTGESLSPRPKLLSKSPVLTNRFWEALGYAADHTCTSAALILGKRAAVAATCLASPAIVIKLAAGR